MDRNDSWKFQAAESKGLPCGMFVEKLPFFLVKILRNGRIARSRGVEGKRDGRCYPLNFCHTSLSKLDPEWEPGLESHIPGRGGKWFCCRGYCLGMWAASECRVGLGAFPALGEKDTLVKEKWFRLQRSERLWVGPTGGGTRTWEYWCHLQPRLDHHFPAQSNFFVTFFLPCAEMSILHVLKPGSN